MHFKRSQTSSLPGLLLGVDKNLRQRSWIVVAKLFPISAVVRYREAQRSKTKLMMIKEYH